MKFRFSIFWMQNKQLGVNHFCKNQIFICYFELYKRFWKMWTFHWWPFFFLIIFTGVSGLTSEKLLSRSARMVNGSSMSIEKAPWQVSVVYVWGNLISSFCGGSIISSKWVITAGYCLHSIDIEDEPYTFISAGSANYTQGSRHRIAEKIRHEAYEEQQGTKKVAVNDIGLLRVKEPFEWGRTRQPISLYERAHVTLVNSLATVSGWSAVQTDDDPHGFDLKFAEMQIISVRECETSLSKLYKNSNVPTGLICAKAPAATICGGDSGGPLTVNGTLVGIVSWLSGSLCSNDFPAIFTEIARYRYWISEKTSL